MILINEFNSPRLDHSPSPYPPPGDREVLTVSNASAPVTKMIVVAGKLWCSAGNVIKIINSATLQLEVEYL